MIDYDLSLSLYIYTPYMYVYTYIYIWREREREREMIAPQAKFTASMLQQAKPTSRLFSLELVGLLVLCCSPCTPQCLFSYKPCMRSVLVEFGTVTQHVPLRHTCKPSIYLVPPTYPLDPSLHLTHIR